MYLDGSMHASIHPAQGMYNGGICIIPGLDRPNPPHGRHIRQSPYGSLPAPQPNPSQWNGGGRRHRGAGELTRRPPGRRVSDAATRARLIWFRCARPHRGKERARVNQRERERDGDSTEPEARCSQAAKIPSTAAQIRRQHEQALDRDPPQAAPPRTPPGTGGIA